MLEECLKLGLIDILKKGKLQEPTPPSDRLIKEDEYPEPFRFTVEDLKEVMKEREIPEEKLKEFEEYVTADLWNWLRDNARSFKIFLISRGRFSKRELSKETIDWLAKDGKMSKKERINEYKHFGKTY